MRVADLLPRELERFEREHPRSRELALEAEESLLSGVPMPWMTRWAGGFPVFAAEAEGARFRDVDGHAEHGGEYVNVFHSHDYIRRTWGRYFDVVAINPGYILTHDLVVLRK